MVDEATRFKLRDVIVGQESEQLLQCLLRNCAFVFGPPGKVVMDQQISLMGHTTGAEFERLGMERVPKGTTAGQGAQQHTGTGLDWQNAMSSSSSSPCSNFVLNLDTKEFNMILKTFAMKVPWPTT